MADEIDSQTKSVSPSNSTMSISEITSYKERRKKTFLGSVPAVVSNKA